jgi:hypothetical protein
MFWGSEGVLECSGLTELGMGMERVDGKIQSGVKPPQSKKEGSGISREDAKARRKGRRRFSVSSLAQVVQLPKTFCGSEGVLECSGLTELWMGIERVDGEIQSGVKPPQSKKEGSGISRGGAETRRVGDGVSQLPKTFCGHEGVLECSGLTELWMRWSALMGKSKAVSSHRIQERGIRNLTRRRKGAKGLGMDEGKG